MIEDSRRSRLASFFHSRGLTSRPPSGQGRTLPVREGALGADKLNAAIKDSRKVLIDRAGHYPFLEHPDKFNQVVMEFLKSQS